jgi:hypothetical protein
MHIILRNLGLSALFAFGLLSIVATGGGGGDNVELEPAPPPARQAPAGLYDGQFTSTITSLPIATQVVGVVSEDLDAFILGSDLLYAGTVSAIDGALSGTLTRYLGRQARFFGIDGTREIALDGTADEAGLSGDYSGTNDEGRFNLVYSSLYEQTSSLEHAAGVWTFTEASLTGPLYIVTLTIDGDGQIFGSDTTGCVFSGELGTIETEFNTYAASMTLTSCGTFDGDYTGLAHLFDLSGAEGALRLSFANTTSAWWSDLQK